jgi:hypothetical protein
MARRALGKKPVSPLVPVALRLKQLGYDPIPLRSGKGTPPKGWPGMANTPADIAMWRGGTVAVRMAGSDDLFAVDLDVQVQEVLDAIIERYRTRWPAFMAGCVIRHSSQVKVMLIGRLKTDKRGMHSGRYGVTAEHKGGNRVELFTSNDSRYIAVWGLHSKDRYYGYDGPELQEIAIDDLPEFLDADLNELLAIVNEVMEAAGLPQNDPPGGGDSEAIYDLTPDMVADLEDGRQLTLEELAEECADGFVYVHGRLLSPGSEHFRIKAKITSMGLTLWDFGDNGTPHYWKHLGPQLDVLAPLLTKLAGDWDAQGIGGQSMFMGARPIVRERLEDFYAYMPEHKYIYIPTGMLWPAASVNSQVRPVALLNADGTPKLDTAGDPIYLKPNTWLDQNRPVQQITWAPGEPTEINGRLLAEGGWIERDGARAFNEYKPPTIVPGLAKRVDRWIALVRLIYPDDVEHITGFFAHRVQRPADKINHGLLLVGAPGIGKDTFIEPLKHAVGPWNFKEVSPSDVMEKYNDYMQAVVVRVSEARDLGEMDRFKLYERMKTMLAAPPDTMRISAKYIPQHYIPNVCGVIITTNHKFDGLYLPLNDRRHYVAGTELTAVQITETMGNTYWSELWRWYQNGGLEDMAAYFGGYDLGSFDAKAPPRQTPTFLQMAGTGIAPEVSEMDTVLDAMGRPAAVTLTLLELETGPGQRDLKEWLRDRKNRRALPHRMDSCGYVPVRNDVAKDGLWVVNGRRQAVYASVNISPDQRFMAASALVNANAQTLAELLAALKNLNQ